MGRLSLLHSCQTHGLAAQAPQLTNCEALSGVRISIQSAAGAWEKERASGMR